MTLRGEQSRAAQQEEWRPSWAGCWAPALASCRDEVQREIQWEAKIVGAEDGGFCVLQGRWAFCLGQEGQDHGE